MPDESHQQPSTGSPDSTLNAADLALIRGIMTEAIKNHQGRFDLSEEGAINLAHLGNLVTSMRQGNVSGVDVIRDNHTMMTRIRKRADKATNLFFVMLFTGTIAAVFAAFWRGLSGFFTGNPQGAP